jgi:predicted nucleic-acid-binding protein
MGGQTLRIAVDTNVLLRDVLQDDPVQARLATKILNSAELVVIPVSVFCEFVWVLRQGYKMPASEIADAIRVLIDSSNVTVNLPAIEAGLAILEKGGDFADGAITYEGRWLGAEEFVSFDKQAVTLLKSQGQRARLLS